jgi:phosphopantothenoylcysteine synthetase/decarboxylase
MRVLISGGGCEEPLDGVRSLCNFSSGRTAAFLCDRMVEQGHEVTAVFAERAIKPSQLVVLHTFRTFQDLFNTLKKLLVANDFGMIIHAAAVSDFGIGSVEVDGISYPPSSCGKIESGSEVVVRLKQNPKIIDHLRDWSRNPNCIMVGFKLTNGADMKERETAVSDLLRRAGVDLVVSNDLSEISTEQHPFRIYGQSKTKAPNLLSTGMSKVELAAYLRHTAEVIQGEGI